ncbi:RNA polymerase subunit sigma-24 [Spirochaetia bacterium]|nr:RNA polymerase subunit sigma-24 [Spirochaetia bacterium]GHU34093.1 RNA polymerase subunit sigma-24 [Spirochaetia bacterium]
MKKADDFDDLMIVQEIVSGQKELFRLLMNRYKKAVYSIGWSFLHNADDASDFSQEVFLKVFRNLPLFEGRARFSTWLYQIAYNTAINSSQRKKEYQSLAEEDVFVAEGTPEQSTLKEALRQAVRQAVAELPERYRVCIDLCFFYERSYQEIALITGFPVSTIKSHVLRAKKMLRVQLADFMEEF